MEHYICTGGCRGETMLANVCEEKSCDKQGEKMSLCKCVDGRHFGTFDLDHSKGPDHDHSLPVAEPERKIM